MNVIVSSGGQKKIAKISNTKIQTNVRVTNGDHKGIILKLNSVSGLRGQKGDPGTGADQIEQVAGQNLSSGRAVIKISGKVYYFDPNDLSHAGKTIGITATSALLDEAVTVSFSGSLTDAAFSFEEGQALYIGLNGQLFETVQDVLIVQRAGVSVEYNKVLIDFFSPIIKI